MTVIINKHNTYFDTIKLKKNNESYSIKYINSSVKNIEVTFGFNHKTFYPFKLPCSIYLNNYSYPHLVQDFTSKYLKLLAPTKCCLLCESLVCVNNWGPSIKLQDILKEIEQFIKYKELFILILHLKVICRKYGCEEEPFLKFLIT